MAVKAQMSVWPEMRLELRDTVRPLTCIDHDRIIVRALPSNQSSCAVDKSPFWIDTAPETCYNNYIGNVNKVNEKDRCAPVPLWVDKCTLLWRGPSRHRTIREPRYEEHLL